MFSETVRRSPATLTGHHHRCYFGVRAETCKCSTSVGMVLCSGAQRGQAQPRAGSGLGEGAELLRRWCQCILDSGKKRCSFSSAHMCNSQWYREPVLLFLCEVLCQLCMAALVSVSVGASREASPKLVLLRQEYGAALILSVDLHVTLVSLSNQSQCMRVIFWLCSGEPGKNPFVKEHYSFISLSFVFSPVLSLALCWVWSHFVSDLLCKLSASVFKRGVWLLPLPRLRKSQIQPARKL